MNERKPKKCIVCEQEYFINIGGQARSKRNGCGTRVKSAHTCSPRCSKIYRRISNNIISRIIYQRDREKIIASKKNKNLENQHRYKKQGRKVYK